MKKIVLALFSFCCFFLNAQHPSADARWNLVFEDEFNGTAINTSKWNPNVGGENKLDLDTATHHCLVPTYLQSYTYDFSPNPDVVVDSGFVKLYVRHHSVAVDGYYWCEDTIGPGITYVHDTIPTHYTKGEIHSSDLFLHGYYEIKFMMPTPPSNGNNYDLFGPNFWLYIRSSSFPILTSEIDIFENNHFDDITRTSNNVHWYDDYALNADGDCYKYITSDEWHTAACNWTEEKIDFYLDDVLIRTINYPWVQNLEPMNIIVDINAFPQFLANSTNEYPYIYKIDYVRVWQLEQDCDAHRTVCYSGVTSTDDTTTYEGVILGGTECDEQTITHGVSFKASEQILIDENITLDPNINPIILEVDGCMEY